MENLPLLIAIATIGLGINVMGAITLMEDVKKGRGIMAIGYAVMAFSVILKLYLAN
jgi:hypothetical protein